MVGWINRVLTNEESPEAKLLRQKISYIGILLIFAAAVGLMPVYQDWTMEVLPAVVVAIIGFVLIVIDMVQTWMGLKMTGQNERVNMATAVGRLDIKPVLQPLEIQEAGAHGGAPLQSEIVADGQNEPVGEGVFHTDVRAEAGKG